MFSDNDGEFQTVKNKRKRMQPSRIDLSNFKVPQSDNSISNAKSQNRYAILGDLNIKTCATSKPSLSNQKSVSSPKLKKSYCPQIFLFDVDVQVLVDELKSKNTPYKIINISNTKSKLYFEDYKAHSEMTQLLKDKNIPSYTYTPKELKRNNMVLRGLYYKTNTDALKKNLIFYVQI